jgi:hypothetical protein
VELSSEVFGIWEGGFSIAKKESSKISIEMLQNGHGAGWCGFHEIAV